MIYLFFSSVLILISILLNHYKYDFFAAIIFVIALFIGFKGNDIIFKNKG